MKCRVPIVEWNGDCGATEFAIPQSSIQSPFAIPNLHSAIADPSIANRQSPICN
jgi:hypothetical protein